MGIIEDITCKITGHGFIKYKTESTIQNLNCCICKKRFRVGVGYDGLTTVFNVMEELMI